MQLDKEQHLAVMSDSDKTLVLAGAGSGKTRVLIERIAHLIQDRKVSPFEIMAFTFTRKAAGEIKARLEERIGPQAYKCTVGTMHSIALGLIQRFGEQIGYRKGNPTVYSQWEEQYLLKDIAIEQGNFKKQWKPSKKHVDAVFADYYQRGIMPDELDPAYGLFKMFIFRCKENNALTYGALLTGLKLLIPKIVQWLRFNHILVDEVQDIDPFQWQIINELQETFQADLFVVGDIDQSIYEWRGAVPKYLLEHQEEFKVFPIQTNYRSQVAVVKAANRLIAHNKDRLEKTMVPARKSDVSCISMSGNCDSAGIKQMIETARNKKYDLSKMVVLSRKHALLKKLSSELDSIHVKHAYVGEKTALTNTEQFRRFHAFLKLIVNPYDNFSFLLARKLMGISRERFKAVRSRALKKGMCHLHAWLNIEGLNKNPYCEYFSQDYQQTLGHCVFQIQYMATGADPYPSDGWGFDVEDIFVFVMDWATNNIDGTILDYLNWLATYDLQDEISGEDKHLQLMTVHAAKGLQWPTVIIAGVNEGLLPIKQAINSDNIEAERRLMYVAVTRAEDNLTITVRPEEKVSESGKIYHNPVSRFIQEMKL